jgi:hypothetical protein
VSSWSGAVDLDGLGSKKFLVSGGEVKAPLAPAQPE